MSAALCAAPSSATRLLPKWLALPIFCSDPISSVAYATEEILLVAGFGGAAYLSMAKPIAALVALLLIVVVASYRQTVYAYPSGGGAFVVSLDNLGQTAALSARRRAARRLRDDGGRLGGGRRRRHHVGGHLAAAAHRADLRSASSS